MNGIIQKRALDILFGDMPILAGDPNIPLKENVIFEVPSQSVGGTYYAVNLERETCGCAYWRKRRCTCKHIAAARLFRSGERVAKPDDHGKTPTQYPNPPWYDEIKLREERAVRELLRCLSNQEQPTRNGTGRPPQDIRDILVLVGLQAYGNKASRKAIPDPKHLLMSGLIRQPAPCERTLLKYMQSAQLKAMLKRAINRTADCVRKIETGFAADSTYLKSSYAQVTETVQDENGNFLTRFSPRRGPVMLQIMVGVETLVAVAADIDIHDKHALIPLIQQMETRFVIEDVYADAGYCVGENFEYIAARGGTAWIDFTETAGERRPMGLPHHDDMLEMYRKYRAEWEARYHKRSVIEAANKVIKTTLKRRIRSRRELSCENEVLALVLVYNLCRLLVARRKHGIDIPWADSRALDVLDGTEGEDAA